MPISCCSTRRERVQKEAGAFSGGLQLGDVKPFKRKYGADHHSHASARRGAAGPDAWLDRRPRPALRTSCTTVVEGRVAASQYSQLLLLLQQLLPACRPARCFSFVDSRLRAGPGATCRSARFLARRPAGCFSFVDSRLRAGPGATCRSARFLARRPAGCFSFVDSRLRAGPGATCLSSGSRFPARRRQRRHPTYPPRHPARLARPPALPL
eukprot:tig00000863_g4971.t1